MKAKEILIQVLGLVLLSVGGVALAILEIAYERFNSHRAVKGFGTIPVLRICL